MGATPQRGLPTPRPTPQKCPHVLNAPTRFRNIYLTAIAIDRLNPVISGWRNYYRYATGAYGRFNHLDFWIWQRVGRWLKVKHRNATWPTLRRRYHLSVPGKRRQWTERTKRLRLLCDGGTMRYPDLRIEKPNGWNTTWGKKQRESLLDFWDAFGRLRTI